MRYVPTKALILIALAAPLGGCNSFLGMNFARHAPRAAPAPEAAALAKADAETATARRLLAEGQTGLAIESFRKALAQGEPVAPAVNGLGVAYARLGRFDLAQRYFQQAMASDPTDARYADNLARLMKSPAFAMRREGDLAQAAVRASVPQDATAKLAGAGAATTPAGKLQRVSRGEVRIATVPAQAAPLSPRGASSAQAALDGRFKPVLRFSIAEPAAQGSIRVTLPEPKPAADASSASGKPAGTPR
jgi:hypothetical protein